MALYVPTFTPVAITVTSQISLDARPNTSHLGFNIWPVYSNDVSVHFSVTSFGLTVTLADCDGIKL